MPAAKVATSKVTENEVDLLADLDNDNTPPVDDEDFDLLSDMAESTATAWVPWNEEDQPNGVQGTVTHIGTVTQEAKYGGEDVPYIELEDKNGTVWGVRGYGTVLANQLQREIDGGLRNGDILAVKTLGMVSNRAKTNEYRNFAVKSKHVGH
jgi:hypothetical protein